MLHGLHNKAPHPRDALLKDRTLGECPVRTSKPSMKFSPNPLVRPALNIFVGGTLQIEPAELLAPHAEQGEAAIMVGVNQLIGGRWCLG